MAESLRAYVRKTKMQEADPTGAFASQEMDIGPGSEERASSSLLEQIQADVQSVKSRQTAIADQLAAMRKDQKTAEGVAGKVMQMLADPLPEDD